MLAKCPDILGVENYGPEFADEKYGGPSATVLGTHGRYGPCCQSINKNNLNGLLLSFPYGIKLENHGASTLKSGLTAAHHQIEVVRRLYESEIEWLS